MSNGGPYEDTYAHDVPIGPRGFAVTSPRPLTPEPPTRRIPKPPSPEDR